MSTRRFNARQSEFEAIRGFIDQSCDAMDRDERQRVLLLIEELFANSVTHGYGGESDEPVWLSVEVGKKNCRIVYEDRAPPYDPFADADTSHVESSVEDRPVGGLGIFLIDQISSSHSYRRRGDRNVIEFEVPHGDKLDGDAPPHQ